MWVATPLPSIAPRCWRSGQRGSSGGRRENRHMFTAPMMPMLEKATKITCICVVMNRPTQAIARPLTRLTHISVRYTGPVKRAQSFLSRTARQLVHTEVTVITTR